jgi:hypothetical protein
MISRRRTTRILAAAALLLGVGVLTAGPANAAGSPAAGAGGAVPTSATAPANATSLAAPADGDVIEVTAHPTVSGADDLPDIVCRIFVTVPVVSDFGAVQADTTVRCNWAVSRIVVRDNLERSGTILTGSLVVETNRTNAGVAVNGGNCQPGTYDNVGSAVIQWPPEYSAPDSPLHDTKSATFTATACGVLVPNLMGLTGSSAKANVTTLGLVPRAGTLADPSCSNPAVVGKQSPQAGLRVAPGSAVSYSVWKPAKGCGSGPIP